MIQVQEELLQRHDKATLRLFMATLTAVIDCQRSEYIICALDRLTALERGLDGELPRKVRLTLLEIIKGARARLVARAVKLADEAGTMESVNAILRPVHRRVSSDVELATVVRHGQTAKAAAILIMSGEGDILKPKMK